MSDAKTRFTKALELIKDKLSVPKDDWHLNDVSDSYSVAYATGVELILFGDDIVVTATATNIAGLDRVIAELSVLDVHVTVDAKVGWWRTDVNLID